ncbi:non-processive endocellulase [Paludibacter propionicigenes WB4]|uniref:Endoglucanase n=1 Tax=Paludibacter propionicigenes (strain DSM 17365 / JCM 13257 / WB4) TaxID=694427 RepID=E4T5B9_PALPW|nr:glycoside hydrolase family 9 protein [Paludibacter propionicigenes]ADQ79913.1 non-processive endocellulase [Paludibacter propionicigenes WB4]
MKKNILLFILLLPIPAQSIVLADETASIKLNSLGYLPQAIKKATVTTEATVFQIINSQTGLEVFQGKLSEPVYQKDVDQKVWIADFSQVTQPGKYTLQIKGVGKSYEFTIGSDVYKSPFVTSMRAFYLWRCGMAVHTDYKGNHYETKACHLEDGWMDYIGKPNERRDGTGGWHDAGDFGKYTVNAGVTMAVLFYAWDHFGNKLKNISLDIPQTAPGMPDFLQELKWETDFLLKMQYNDGSGRVSHKLTRKGFEGFVMPQDDKEKRYFTEWGSAATADFVAIMAMAARYFKPYDAVYAQKCLDAATVSYNFLLANTATKNFVQGDFSTGGYQTGDADDRLWASAEMWETTGSSRSLIDLESRIEKLRNLAQENWDWGNIDNLGVFTYALSKREGKNPQLQAKVKQAILTSANLLVEKAQADVYARPLAGLYFWGCNGTVGRQAVNLQVANILSPNKKYTETILDIIAHLFGRNYYGRSYVTGLGVNPPMYPHDRRSAADDIEAPWPGYLVGGGHTATDWVDKQADYSRNEIAINWQAGLVYALAGGL